MIFNNVTGVSNLAVILRLTAMINTINGIEYRTRKQKAALLVNLMRDTVKQNKLLDFAVVSPTDTYIAAFIKGRIDWSKSQIGANFYISVYKTLANR